MNPSPYADELDRLAYAALDAFNRAIEAELLEPGEYPHPRSLARVS